MKTKNKKIWVLAPHYSDDIISQLLKVRGIDDPEAFLRPDFNLHLHDPRLLSGMDETVRLITEAVEKKQTIGIFGDYDCDGIPGASLLYLGLKQIGAVVAVYIPKRDKGYGLNTDGIDSLINRGAKLIISVDCGITSIKEVEYAKLRGAEVIISDHHEPGSVLPNCIIVNPKLPKDKYPFRELCGTGVVYKIISALSQRFPTELSEKWLKWNLDLVALATICDMVPMTNENRILAYFGLKTIRQSRNIGLNALIENCGITAADVDSYQVGFVLGPRINAIGRMDLDPILSWELLTTNNASEAKELSRLLSEYNEQRQGMLKKALLEAEELIRFGKWDEKAAIILHHPEWSVGIIGLIAAKLLDKYHRPVFIFEGKDEAYKGSARSIKQFPLPKVLAEMQQYFDGFGGHELAAGMTLKSGNLVNFINSMLDLASKKLSPEERIPHLPIDAVASIEQINTSLIMDLKQLEPYGIGNNKPRFLLQKVKLANFKRMGLDGIHLRGVVKQKGLTLPFVAFGFGGLLDADYSDEYDIVATIDENKWRGNITIQLSITDWEKV